MLIRWLALLRVPRYTGFPSRSRCLGVQAVRGCVGYWSCSDLPPFTTRQHSSASTLVLNGESLVCSAHLTSWIFGRQLQGANSLRGRSPWSGSQQDRPCGVAVPTIGKRLYILEVSSKTSESGSSSRRKSTAETPGSPPRQ
jgi:hypothetical protein